MTYTPCTPLYILSTGDDYYPTPTDIRGVYVEYQQAVEEGERLTMRDDDGRHKFDWYHVTTVEVLSGLVDDIPF